jgi:PKHD-type hydroxylase
MSISFKNDLVENWVYAENLFTVEECKKIIDYGNSLKKEIAEIGSAEKSIYDKKNRDNQVAWIHYGSENVNWIFERLSFFIQKTNQEFFNFDLWGIMEPLQFTEYKAPGQHYGQHIDKGYKQIIRKLSISVQLSDPNTYEGGDLNIITNINNQPMKRNQGSITIFPSYILHKVDPVSNGTRYSLVAWVTGNQFR